MKYDRIAVSSLRGLSLDMITKANSGHPGICLSAAPLLYTLYTRHLVSDPNHPDWINRDRFILSAGHGSALLYANLYLAGFHVPMDQLKLFRQLDSLCPGHPEVGHTPGVDATSGPLGQGLAQAVGFALAETHLQTLYPEGEKLINHYTYALCGDGCLEEGVSQEAISLAGLYKLNKLILLYDRNDCTLDGPLVQSSVEDVALRFEAAGWNVLKVADGNDVEEIDKALSLAKTSKAKPTIIICHTIIGYGSPLAGTAASHGKPLSLSDVIVTKENLGVSFAPFDVPEEAVLAYRESFTKRGALAYLSYQKESEAYSLSHPEEYQKFRDSLTNDISPLLFQNAPVYPKDYSNATRNTSNALLGLLSTEVPQLIGGSADVASSVKTKVKEFQNYTAQNRSGKNLCFGIREFGEASLQNGMLLHGGLRTYVGSFLVFVDYMKPAIRMAAMEKIPAVYLFSHDSVDVGEDGPTHQPIEQLTMLRSIPNLSVFRPGDAIETSAAYKAAFSSTDHPTALILTRQNVVNNPGTSFEGALKGGYVVSYEKGDKPSYTLLATGSEVNKAVSLQKILLEKGIDTRVVSLPSLDVFDKQTEEYRNEVYGAEYSKRFFLEMGKTDLLYKYAGNPIGIDTFGTSAPDKDAEKKMGFDLAALTIRILDRIRVLEGK